MENPRLHLPSKGPWQQPTDSSHHVGHKPTVWSSQINRSVPLQTSSCCRLAPLLPGYWVRCPSSQQTELASTLGSLRGTLSFPLHLPGRRLLLRRLTTHRAPAVDKTQGPLPLEPTVLHRREESTPHRSRDQRRLSGQVWEGFLEKWFWTQVVSQTGKRRRALLAEVQQKRCGDERLQGSGQESVQGQVTSIPKRQDGGTGQAQASEGWGSSPMWPLANQLLATGELLHLSLFILGLTAHRREGQVTAGQRILLNRRQSRSQPRCRTTPEAGPPPLGSPVNHIWTLHRKQPPLSLWVAWVADPSNPHSELKRTLCKSIWNTSRVSKVTCYKISTTP